MPYSPGDTPTLQTSIRRQIATAANLRYLRSLPTFHVERELPDELQQKLDRMECAELAAKR